jgi:hypothetical protein
MIYSKADQAAQKAYSGAGAIANEYIAAMRTVQSFNLQEIGVWGKEEGDGGFQVSLFYSFS